MYVEAELWRDNQDVSNLMDLYDHIRNSETKRHLGFSIEGIVTERDDEDESIIKAVTVTGVAVTKNPANGQALLSDVIKSNNAKQIKAKQTEKTLEAGYGTSPETQQDGGALRPETMADHVTFLVHSIKQLNETENLSEFTQATAKLIDERNPEDDDIKAMFLQIMTGVSRNEALDALNLQV